MAVKHEIKSQLAKLLATEDLIVEHKSVKTAQFNVHTRVLILPQWERASNNVYDMLVGHEVGHALYTPDEWDWLDRIPQNFVNVVEDARIEKLMKRKYPGLAKTFYNGYNELHDNDFFEVNDEDISTFNLADRANLYFKVGSFLPVAFSATEKPIINLINDCETFTETLSAAEALYNFCKQELRREEGNKTPMEGEQVTFEDLESSIDNNLDGDLGDDSSISDSDGSPDMESGCNNAAGNDRVDDTDPTVETADRLSEALKELSNDTQTRESTYFELPKLNLDTLIIPNDHIHNNMRLDFADQQKVWDNSEHTGLLGFSLFEEVDSEYIKFKRSAQKEVNYLVKEFECKKSADSYARATTARIMSIINISTIMISTSSSITKLNK